MIGSNGLISSGVLDLSNSFAKAYKCDKHLNSDVPPLIAVVVDGIAVY